MQCHKMDAISYAQSTNMKTSREKYNCITNTHFSHKRDPVHFMAMYYVYCFILGLRWLLRAETCCSKLFKITINSSFVRLYS
jgi:hypothetical protein